MSYLSLQHNLAHPNKYAISEFDKEPKSKYSMSYGTGGFLYYSLFGLAYYP